MSSTEGSAPDHPGAAGWYPDPDGTGRRRYWDGERWSGIAASAGGATASPVPPPAREAAAVAGADRRPRRRTTLIAGGLALAVVTALALGAVVLLGPEDSPTPSDVSPDPGSGVQSGPTPPRDTAPTGSGQVPADPGAPADPADPGASTSVPGPPADPTDAGTGPTEPDDGTEPCTADEAELLDLLRAHPPLATLAGSLVIAEVRCAGEWSSARVSAADTDAALALFRRDGAAWTFVLVGSAEPCSGLGIPPSAEPLLGCGAI